jgi:hypothetical protein
LMPATERIAHWIKMRRYLARFNDPASSNSHTSWADFITASFGAQVFGTHRQPYRDRHPHGWLNAAISCL